MSVFTYDETELFYKEIGSGIPFLLIHGWAIDHVFLEKCLEPIFEEININFRRIYVDVPGMGRSKPGKVKNGDGIVRVLNALMEEIAPGENYYVGGNSFGSVVARAMTALYTDKILGLMLLAPAGDGKLKVPSNGVFYYDNDFMETLSEEEREEFKLMNANLCKATYDRYKQLVEASVLINADNDFLHRTLKGKFSFDINKMIMKKHFDKATLILTGKYDIAVGYEEQFGWLSVFTRATYVVIDGAGHNIHVDQPQMFHNTVKGWLLQLK